MKKSISFWIVLCVCTIALLTFAVICYQANLRKENKKIIFYGTSGNTSLYKIKCSIQGGKFNNCASYGQGSPESGASFPSVCVYACEFK